MITRRTVLTTAVAAPLALHVPSASAASRRAVWWKEGPVLNQRGKAWCEAFALVGAWASATQAPITTRDGNRLARYIFETARDQLPPNTTGVGEESLLEAARDLGMMTTWARPQTVGEMLDCLPRAPIPVFIRATRQWSNAWGERTTEKGHGSWEGHAVVVTAYRRGQIRLRNSWGRHWGINGSAWMPVSDLRAMWGSRRHYGHYNDAYLADWTIPSTPPTGGN